MNPKKHQQLAMSFAQGAGPRVHALFDYPLLTTWISELMPELLQENPASANVLKQIYDYLFQQQKEESALLEKHLTEELYACLHGLKIILLSFNNNWESALNCLEQHQRITPSKNRPEPYLLVEKP
jgi:hypothetical protein